MRHLVRTWWRAAAVAILCAGIARPAAQSSATIYRVFLTDGRSVASFGESVAVGDRVVFMVPVGGEGTEADLQLTSLPAGAVDRVRTDRYTESVRAAHYAATRGEADYQAVTRDVAVMLDQLRSVEDPRRRLVLAEEAKRKLFAWSEANYQFRADDIQMLGTMFDDVINTLRAAAGESSFTVDLSKGPAGPKREPLLPAPGLRESIEMALIAAGAADVLSERRALLRAAETAAARSASTGDLRQHATDRLAVEEAADRAYASLSASIIGEADAARRRGDVRALDALRRRAVERDRALGSERPDDLRALLAAIDAKLDAVRADRAALAHYFAVRDDLVRYERRVRPVLSGLDGLGPVLGAIRATTGPRFASLGRAAIRLNALLALLKRLKPPDDARDIHAAVTSAVQMAREAVDRRRRAAIAPAADHAGEASAAAAGAQLLAAEARRGLLALLRPPQGVR